MRLRTWLVLAPAALAGIWLAVANRHTVAFSIDPFSTERPALVLETPLFVVILVSILAGILLGGFAAWAAQGRWRKRARQSDREAARLADELTKSEPKPSAESGAGETAQLPAPNKS